MQNLRVFVIPPQWKGEIQEFCPNTKMLLVGCKSDLRTDLSTLVELSNHRQTPVSYDQASSLNEFNVKLVLQVCESSHSQIRSLCSVLIQVCLIAKLVNPLVITDASP